MRTTVAISDEVLMAAKRRARQRGVTLGQLIDAALQKELNDSGSRKKAPSVPVFSSGTGVRPGIDLNSNRALQEVLDEEIELNKRR